VLVPRSDRAQRSRTETTAPASAQPSADSGNALSQKPRSYLTISPDLR
jgi:hypothetical protein